MRDILKACIVLCLVTLTQTLSAQNGQFDARFLIHDIDVVNMKFYLDIEIRAETSSSTFNISEQNYRFEYDQAVLGNPSLDQELTLSGIVTNTTPPTFSSYEPHSLTGSQPGLVSYNVELAYGDGYPLNAIDYIKVGRLVFDILDLGQTINLIWHDAFQHPVTFIGEKRNDSLFALTEGSFGNYIQDLSVLQQTNQAPQVSNDFATVPAIDSSIIDILANDTDSQSGLNPASVSILTMIPASQGTITTNSAGQIIFTPAAGFSGNVSTFQYEVCDFGLLVPAAVGEQNPNSPAAPVPTDPPVITTDPMCSSASVSIEVLPPPPPDFQLRVLLEGPYQSGAMTTNLPLYNLLPEEQPYNVPPWNYMGTEASTNPPASTVDWVLVTLRYAQDHSTTIARSAGFLGSDGWIKDIDGDNLEFQSNISSYDSLYIAVYHRNHVGQMSAKKIAINTETVVYDFTDDADKSFQGQTGTKQIEPGVFAMFGGDYNANGQVQNTDYNFMISFIGLSGYHPGDFDLNGQVQNVDIQENLFPNIGRGANFSY